MAGFFRLTGQTLGSSQTFNWTWFIELVTCGILVLWFTFYLNRLFATAVSYGIRTYSWHKFRVYLEIKSLQISFLGGRIFFKGVRYHGENETVYIHNGHLTWRYWLQATKQVDLSDRAEDTGPEYSEKTKEEDTTSTSESDTDPFSQPRGSPESRVLISISGLEWFIYNRTPVYDSIVQEAGIRASGSASTHGRSTANALSQVVQDQLRQRLKQSRTSDVSTVSDNEKEDDKDGLESSHSRTRSQDRADSVDSQSVHSRTAHAETDVSSFYSIMLRFFPVGVECSRGAVSLGNENTKAIIVTTFEKAKGHIDAGASGPADIFRQIFDFDIAHPVVQMKPNPDFHLPQMAAAERIITGHESVLKGHPWWRISFDFTKRRRLLTSGLRNLVPSFRRSVASFHNSPASEDGGESYTAFSDNQPRNLSWHGLDRYMDEDEGDDHQAWLSIEYARYSTIFDSPLVHLKFFWDTPGNVKPEHVVEQNSGLAADLNGIPPPAYGMHLDVHGGMVNYGPWSDRLRVEIQNVFLPAGYRNVEPKESIAAGEPRVNSVMNITVNIEKEITLRVPSREGSKDWRWRGRATAVRDAAALRKQQQRRHFRFRRANKRRLGPDVRPFGWISISAGAGSRVRYTMDMYPGRNGYHNTLQLTLKNTRATSSVNHATLWQCDEQNVAADLSNPLGWNHLHTWRFDIMNKNMNLFLLRDHTALLIDLIADFTAGQKSDYMTFMPFHYTIGVKFLDLSLFLNSNDYNIIDSPCDLEENAFLILGFARLAGQVDIPMHHFSPAQSSVIFKGDGQDASLKLTTPVWHTLHNFGRDETMATLETLELDGSYNYYSGTSPKFTDSLFMKIIGGSPLFHLQGYLIRYFMNVKENYFGDDIHFSTIEEHQAKLESLRMGEEEKKPPPKKQNDLDVILSVRADNCAALMPAGIYDRDENLRIDVLLAEADMRFTNYYMDLQVNSSPIEVSTEKYEMDEEKKPKRSVSGCQLFIDGVGIYGHRLFGAPPTEPTYLCNWDFDVGEVSGECNTDCLRIMLSAILSFVFTMDDYENALVKTEATLIPDVTFLRMKAASIRIWIVSADTAFLVAVDASTVELNDWANKHFSKYIKVNAPLLLVAAVDSTAAYRYREDIDRSIPTIACLKTSIRLAVLDRKSDFAHHRALQQEHIRFHDSRTHRAEWLLHKQYQHVTDRRLSQWSQQPLPMPVPNMPPPVYQASSGAKPGASSASFLSGGRESAKQRQPHHIQIQATSQDSGGHKISSQWARPSFQLWNIQPDLLFLPTLDQVDLSNDTNPEEFRGDEDFPVTKEDFTHNGIFCNLFNGIVGFCTPDIALSIITLLNEISPQQPKAILDDLQMQTMSNIQKMTRQHVGQIDDLSFRLPAAQIRIVSPHTAGNMAAGHDQYDIELRNVRAIARIAPVTHSRTTQTNSLVHISLQELGVAVSVQTQNTPEKSPSAKIALSDAGLWLSLKEEIRARAQLSNFDVVTSENNVSNLASIIQRTEAVALQVSEQSELIDHDNNRQHLLYHLTSVLDYVDPIFMSKLVNVIRATDSHTRMHDSWKMIMRLRHILMTQTEQHKVPMNCKTGCGEDQEETQSHILSAFDRWRSWEAAGKDEDAIVQAVFGSARVSSARPATDVEVEVLIGRAAFAIDHGLRQTQFLVQSLDLNYAEKFLGSSDNTWTFDHPARTKRVLQLYAGSLAAHLDWGLVDLAIQIVKLAAPLTSSRAKRFSPAPTAAQMGLGAPELQIVVGADATSLEVDGNNFGVVTGLERLQVSANIGIKELQRQIVTVTLSAASGRLRVRGLGKSTLSCKVTAPTIYINVQDEMAPSHPRLIIHSAASAQKFRLQLKQDVLQILAITQAILRDEAVAIRQLVSVLPKGNEISAKSLSQTSGPSKDTEPHLALFLDDYLMQFDLMTYLRYQISGKTARTSIVPHSYTRFSVQIDLKENQHSFESPHTRSERYKSYLSMPPLSAAVNVSLFPGRTRLSARITTELMHLDASAVRACFDAAYRPQTIAYVTDVRNSVTNIQKTMESLSPTQKPMPARESVESKPHQIEYQAHLVFEGVRVYCTAPALRPDQNYSVNLTFVMGAASMQVSNLQAQSGTLLKKPNFRINLHRILVELERVAEEARNFGQFATSFKVICDTNIDEVGDEIQHFSFSTSGVNVDLHSESMVLVVDLISFLQARIKSLAAAEDAKKLKPLRRLTLVPPDFESQKLHAQNSTDDEPEMGLLKSTVALQLNAICVRWLLHEQILSSTKSIENMAFTVTSISLRTKRDASARLTIRGLQLQLVPFTASDPFERTANSALLPEMVFNAAYARTSSTRKFAFKAAGKHLDVRLASNFIIPASAIQKSVAQASTELRSLKLVGAKSKQESTQAQLPKLLGTKRLAQLLVFAEFGGAEVTVSPAKEEETQEQSSAFGLLKGPKRSKAGRYGQAVQSSTGESATLRSPSIAFQIEYADTGQDDPTLSTEIRVAASSNTLAPSVVPLILEISSSVTNLMEQDNSMTPKTPNANASTENSERSTDTMPQATDPTAILGRVKLNAGLLVQKQEFSLTCQPVARVSATARFDEIFVVVNTAQAKDQDRFFSITTTLHNLSASVQHVYSRESTANFTVESIMVSLMNSKHFSDQSGISAILNVSPMKGYLNAKQMQDFLLFREIWYPAELRSNAKGTDEPGKDTSPEPALQRFQEVTTTSVLPWHAIVSIAELKFHIDFGQSIGKADFSIQKLWASSKKNSDSEQNLVIGLDSIGIESKGRTSGFAELQGFRVRTGIRWPTVGSIVQAPLVQGSVGFEHLKSNAVFDYQPFAVVDISTFDFLIYNVRQDKASDRLVGILDGGKVQVFGITTAAAQGLSIFQAFERLVQEKQEAFEASLHELDKYLRRKSVFPTITQAKARPKKDGSAAKKSPVAGYAPHLHVDVVITVQAIDAGVFMSSFYDETCLKLEAVDVQARFAVGEAEEKTHSGLGMSLGQVRLALSALARPNAGALREVSVSEVIDRATAGRGGTILKVPRLVASMQTWQMANSNAIEYIFHSTFLGKVDIGWNYSRISTIRNMWESHSRALAQKMDKPLPPSAIKITAEPKKEAQGQEKITAVVHMPQSKYEYIPLRPPVIDTPQLRDLGEATPSLEWIGLHRERLPHVTHSIIIVSLLEVAKEIEESYGRILGSGER